MLKLNERGSSKVEMIISGCLFAGMVFFSQQMFEKQTQTVLMANQNIEVTTIINDIRNIFLEKDNCFKMLNGKELELPVGEIETLLKETISGEYVEKFPTMSKANNVYGNSKIRIESYELNELGLSKQKVSGQTNLIVTFNRGASFSTDVQIRKQIILEYQLKDGKINECGVSLAKGTNLFWSEKGNIINFLGRNLAIKTNIMSASLNIGGAIVIRTKELGPCEAENAGTLSFSETKGHYNVCLSSGKWEALK